MLNVAEYQAKKLFRDFGLPLLDSETADSASEAAQVARRMGGESFVLKAQILAGGRGKAGGIKLTRSIDELEREAGRLLNSRLITPQTSKEGELVEKLLVEKACSIKKEFYLAILLNPSSSLPELLVSPEGGMDIEELSLKSPEKILKLKLGSGFQPWQAYDVVEFLGLSTKEELKQVLSLGQNMFRLFNEKDALLLEINPLAQTSDDRLIALDGKMSFDENALFRHKDLKSIYQNQERSEAEAAAMAASLAYIPLDGDIACMVNGAGLAMATMDIIQLYGGRPANFLDVGGGAEKEKVKKAFEIILKSKRLKSILVNIFGGIMRCDVIAEAFIQTAEEINIPVPVVIRLEGTKSKEGLEQLAQSSLNLISARDLDTAAKKAVEAAKNS